MTKKNTPSVSPSAASNNSNNKGNHSTADVSNADVKKAKTAPQNNKQNTNNVKKEEKTKSKSKKGLIILILLLFIFLIAFAGYFIHFHETKFNQRINALQNQISQLSSKNNQTINNEKFASLTDSINSAQLTNEQLSEKVNLQQKNIDEQQQSLEALQAQVNNLNINNRIPQAVQPTDWLLAESDYLLNNALHKLIIDNDVETAIALLQVADETLSKMNEPQIIAIRSAINSDLKQLFAVNNIDQDAIMQHLSSLANQIDNLMILSINSDERNNDVSDSIGDWKKNLSKNIDSFFDNFIKVTKRNAEEKALLAPNQDIYLRENIRLRLQIAIMAVPRQQNTLYHQSLDMVATWIRSYFDTSNPEVQAYLTTLDKLSQQSIYVNTPTELKSLKLLDQLLNKTPKKLQKVKISADKSLNVENQKTENTAEEAQLSETQQSTEDASHHSQQQSQPAVTEDK